MLLHLQSQIKLIMNQGILGEIFMDKIWHTLTLTYHQFIVRLGPSISMTWTALKEASVNVLSSVLALFQVVLSYFTLCCQMVPSIIGCLSQRFPKKFF
jgi:uncharacterized membrane protein YhaH (DUF805 family)